MLSGEPVTGILIVQHARLATGYLSDRLDLLLNKACQHYSAPTEALSVVYCFVGMLEVCIEGTAE